MKSINVTQNTNRTTEMIVGLNTQHTLCAKVNTRSKDQSKVEIDITCTDRDEMNLIEAFLKKKRYKFNEDFHFQTRSANPGWSDHVILKGENVEKILRQICEMLEIKLPERNFYLD